MKLKGTVFNNVLLEAGALNSLGEGWPFHRYYKHISGFSFDGATFISKTITTYENTKHVKMKKKLQDIRFFPSHIKTCLVKGLIFDAIDLAGPGAGALIKEGKWQKRPTPFFISFTTIGNSKSYRLAETKEFVLLLKNNLPYFGPAIGIEKNASYPENVFQELDEKLAIIKKLELPILLKVSTTTKPELVKKLIDNGLCDAITVSASPCSLEYFHPSPTPIASWIKDGRDKGIEIPINAGSGVSSKEDVDIMDKAGASAISICTPTIISIPWAIQGLIDYANSKFA